MGATFTAVTAAQQCRQFNVFQRIERRDQHEGLKDKPDMTCAERGTRLFIKLMQRLPDQVDLSTAAVVQTG